MAEFTQEEVSTIERLVGEGGYSVQDAQDLIKGSKTPQSIFESKSKGLRTITDDSNNLDGFDKKLGIDTLKKLEEGTKSLYGDSEGIVDPDTSLMTNLAPSYWDQVKARGIRTDKGLSAGDRAALSFGFSEPQFLITNTKKLIIDDLSKKFPKEEIEKYKDNIKVQVADVGYDALKSDALIYKIPKELGGDNYFRTVNKEGPDLGDVPSISGDAIPFTLSTSGAVAGSTISPVIGTAAGAGIGEASGEFIKLMAGRKAFGLQPDLSDEQFMELAIKQSLKKGAVSGLTMGAFQKVVPYLVYYSRRFDALGSGENYLSKHLTDTIVGLEKEVKEKGVEAIFNKELLDTVAAARKKLVDSGIPEEQIDQYLAINIQKAIPQSKVFQNLSAQEKERIGELLGKNKVIAEDIENKVTSELTGINDLTEAGMNKAKDRIKTQAETIVIGEQATADKSVAANQLIRDKEFKNLNFSPSQTSLDDFGFYTSKLIEQVRERMSTLNTQITNFSKKNPEITRVELDLSKDNLKTWKRILSEGKFDEPKKFEIQSLKSIPKNATDAEKLAIEAENKIISGTNRQKELFRTPEYQQTFNILKDLQKSFSNKDFLQNLTYGDAKRTLSILRNLEQQNLENPKLLGGIRLLKGNMKDAIATVENKPGNELLKNLSDEWTQLDFGFKNSSLQDIARAIGSRVTPAVAKAADNQSEKIFTNIMGDNINARANSKALGDILRNENFTNNDKFKSSLFKFYHDEVVKGSGEAGAARMTHGEFMEKYGTNFKNILGDDLFNQFKKGPGFAQQQVEKYVAEKVDLVKNGSRVLPGLGLDIKNWTPEKIVDAILQKGPTVDVNVLKKAFGPEYYKDVQTAFLENMYSKTKNTFTTTSGPKLFGLVKPTTGTYEAFDGVRLLQYLKENKGIIEKFMGKEFYDVHKDLGRALTLLQQPEKILTGEGLTGAANKAGLFIDMIYGPLNHNRLVVNRLGRIYDSIDGSGKQLDKVLNYKSFIEQVKKQFIGGNYPKWLDDLSPAQQSTFMSKLTVSLDQSKLGQVVKEVAGRTRLIQAGEKIERGAEKFKEISTKIIPEKYQTRKAMGLTPILIDKYFEEGTVDPMIGTSNQRAGQPYIIQPPEAVSKGVQKLLRKAISGVIDGTLKGAKYIAGSEGKLKYKEPEFEKIKQLRKEAK
jgi:hypothetical protein